MIIRLIRAIRNDLSYPVIMFYRPFSYSPVWWIIIAAFSILKTKLIYINFNITVINNVICKYTFKSYRDYRLLTKPNKYLYTSEIRATNSRTDILLYAEKWLVQINTIIV